MCWLMGGTGGGGVGGRGWGGEQGRIKQVHIPLAQPAERHAPRVS